MIDRERKIELIAAMQRGEVKADSLPQPIPEQIFKAVAGGKFKNTLTGDTLTLDEIKALNDSRGIPYNWFKYKETRGKNGAISSIKLERISRFEQLQEFTQDDFLTLMKKATACQF